MRQSLPDLALELSMGGIILHQRTAPGQWAELGATRIDVPDLGANLRAMRDMADTARGKDFRTQIWLPDDQVIANNLLLTGETQKEREQSARSALAVITPHRGNDFTIVLGAPSVSGYTPVAAVLLQTLKEARVFAEDNGFRPVGFSTRNAPPGFDFTPAFSEPLDLAPLKRKLSFVAGLGLALLAGGIGFRIADPYGIWVPPPQVVTAPQAIPEMPLSASGGQLSLAAMQPAEQVQPMPTPGNVLSPEDAITTAPVFKPAAAQSQALVATPDWQAPNLPQPLAETSATPFTVVTFAEPPATLFAAATDRLPSQDSPRVQQRFAQPDAPGLAADASILLAGKSPATLAISPPLQITTSERLATRSLPNPAVTHAFPLDNLDAIVAAAKILSQSNTTQRAAASAPGPQQRLAVTLPNSARPPLPNAAAALPSQPGQIAAAMPDIGKVALLRPFAKPLTRPSDLQTQGEFERAVPAPDSPSPTVLAMAPPQDTPGPSDDTPAQENSPQPPFTEISGLSNPLAGLADPRPGQSATVAPTAAVNSAAQQLSSPAPGDLVATARSTANPPAIVEADTTPVPTETAETTEPDAAPGDPATELASAQVQDLVDSVQEPEDPWARYAEKRPLSRPASIRKLAERTSLVPTEYALLTSPLPKGRPATLELKAAAALRTAALIRETPSSAESQDEPEVTGAVFTPIPSSASVQRVATIENALDRSKISLIGVYGTAAKPRALIRLPSGRFVRVEPGDKFGRYQVASISSSSGSIKLLRSGKGLTLKVP